MPKTINKTHGPKFHFKANTAFFLQHLRQLRASTRLDRRWRSSSNGTGGAEAMELVASTRLSKEGSRPQWVKRYDAHEPQFVQAMKLMDGGIIMFLWMILKEHISLVKDWDIPWWNSLNLTDHRCGEFSNRTIEHNYMQELNRLLENVNETEIEIQTCFFSLSSYSGYIGYMWIGVSSYLWIPSISWKGSPTPVSSIADWAAWKLPEVPLLPGLSGHVLG